METSKNSRKNIHKMHNIKACFKNVEKIYPKRKSDDISDKANVLLFLKNNISIAETAGESQDIKIIEKKKKIQSNKNIPKEKKNICIKYKDLIVESEESEDRESHMELALRIKKKRKTNIPKCNNNNKIFLHIHKAQAEEINIKLNKKKNNSVNNIILSSQKEEEENIIIRKIKKKFLCCY